MLTTTRRFRLFELSCLIALLSAPSVADAADPSTPTGPKSGELAPVLVFTDILGVESGSVAYPEHIQIVSFATQETSEHLMAWMSGLTKKIATSYPNLSLVYFSFADLAEVPAFLRPIARPILESMIGSEIEPMQQRFKAKAAAPGLPAPKAPEFHLIADWDGSFLEQFGYGVLQGYHCWVIHKGRVMGHFTPKTPNKDEAFVALFGELQAGREDERKVASPRPSSEPTDYRGTR
jgi:hypothetical protein